MNIALKSNVYPIRPLDNGITKSRSKKEILLDKLSKAIQLITIITKNEDHMNEIELCKVLINQLNQDGWEVYQEVITPFGRVDVVAVKDNKQWAIEVKTSAGLDTVQQAKRSVGFAHSVSIATPGYPRFSGRQYCREHGIGIIQITDNGFIQIRKPRISLAAGGLLVFEEQKTMNTAGSKHGGYWIPSKEQKTAIKSHYNQGKES